MNLPTLIIAAVVVVVLIAILVHAVRNKKRGDCSCSSSCGSCSGCGVKYGGHK